MSIASVASSNPFSGFSVNSPANTSKQSQLREQFQQLGQDLQVGQSFRSAKRLCQPAAAGIPCGGDHHRSGQ